MKSGNLLPLIFILLLISCNSIIAPTPTPTQPEHISIFTPSSTSIPFPTKRPMPTETQSLSELSGKWIQVVDEEAGIAFEYPAVYEHPEYSWCKPWVSTSKGKVIVEFAGKSYFTIFTPKIQTVDEMLNELKNNKNYNIETIFKSEMFGYPSTYVQYRFGSLDRYGAAEFAETEDKLITYEFEAGPFCDIPEIGFYESDALRHFSETFQFLDK